MKNYQGQRTQGPYNKMLEILQTIGLSIQVPYLIDHDGIAMNILEIEEDVFYQAIKKWMGSKGIMGTGKEKRHERFVRSRRPHIES